MANKNSKAKAKLDAKSGQAFHGKLCHTGFEDKHLNPMNNRTSPWRGGGAVKKK